EGKDVGRIRSGASGQFSPPPSGGGGNHFWRKYMNWDRVEGNWKQVKGKVKEQWGKITDDELDVIAGRRDQLLGAVQKSYGVAKDEADGQINDWEKRNERAFDASIEASRTSDRRAGR